MLKRLPARRAATTDTMAHAAEFWFAFVLGGQIDLEVDGTVVTLVDGDAVTIPSTVAFRWSQASTDLELLEVTLPDVPPVRTA